MSAILGHDDTIRSFLAAMRGDRPHHGWLFTGSEGLGKASTARQLGARLLAEAAGLEDQSSFSALPDEHPTIRLLAAHSHPDFKWIEREIWQKGQKDRLVPFDERKSSDEPSRSIRVAQIRWLGTALALAPSLSSRRVVVIDAADDLEINSSNALLKMLEEPPAGTIFILICHTLGRLLPTIRSRCRIVRFSALSDELMTSVLRRHLEDASPAEVAALVQLGQGSPGKAIRLAGVGVDAMIESLEQIARTGDPDNGERVKLSSSMSAKASHKRFEAFLGLVPSLIASQARVRQGNEFSEALERWEKARDLAQQAILGSLDPQAVTFALASHVAALAPGGSAAKA